MHSNNCPVCGFDLGFAAWVGNSASDEICPCCGIQFGYDDAADGNIVRRRSIYVEWRQTWITEGMPWRGNQARKPEHWDPAKQLSNAEVSSK